jgi:hypothetical protein
MPMIKLKFNDDMLIATSMADVSLEKAGLSPKF